MDTKSKLLRLLEENRELYISGSMLANKLSVSRNAVWKNIEQLRKDGYAISAATRKGYRLEEQGDILSAAEINKFIQTSGVFQVEVQKTVTSTNTVLRDKAEKGAPEGYVLAAQEQTAGKGRRGRTFHSPAKHGIYFSLLLRPGNKANDATLITSAAAVATAKAIKDIFNVETGIKWVNDLYTDAGKICGILTEATIGMESGLVESAVLGIGVNITKPAEGYPENLNGIIAALTMRHTRKDSERCRLIAATLDHFWKYYENLSGREFLNEYRARSIVLGRDILVLSNNEEKPAQAIEINDNCELIVRYENNEVAALSSGEVSIKRMQEE